MPARCPRMTSSRPRRISSDAFASTDHKSADHGRCALRRLWFELIDWSRPGQEEALSAWNTELAQCLELFGSFHTFSDHGCAQFAGERQERLRERPAHGIMID